MKSLRLSFAALLTGVLGLDAAMASTIVLGGYPDELQLVDSETGAVTDRVKLQTGLPTSMHPSSDGSLIYVTTNTTSGIEVFDVATRRIINQFSLNTPMRRYRFNGGVPDPTGRYFYILGNQIDRERDRYRVSKTQFMVVDLQEERVVRTVAVEPQDERLLGRAQMVMSDDGETLYVFRDKVLIVDTAELKVVERIDLAKPESPGMRDVVFGSALETLRRPGEYVSLFNSEDPFVQNETFGIARFDLASRRVSYTPIGPAPDRMAGLEVTPDGRYGYTVASNGAQGNITCEFWRFDLQTNRAVNRADFPCRTRFYFAMSENGEKLYIYGAGFDIAVYDAETLRPEADWELTNDITMAGMLFIP